MQVYLLSEASGEGDIEQFDQALRNRIPDLKRIQSIDEILSPSVRDLGRPVVIRRGPKDADDLAKLIAYLETRRQDVFVIVVGGDLSALDYKRLLQAGNAEWVANAGSIEEILGIVWRVNDMPELHAGKRPTVISFLPSGGGVGNTTLAIETAIQLAARKSGKDAGVAIVDLDFQASHVCDYLDIAPKFLIEEINQTPERLDSQLLEVYASRHSSGVDVFAAQRDRLRIRDLGVDVLSALFERLAQRYSLILVDLPVSAHAWTVPLLTASEGILVTGVNTIPGLRLIADTLRAVRAERAISAEAAVVVNRCEAGVFGKIARRDHVARVLGDERLFYVRNSDNALECINMGLSMTLTRPSDRAVKDIGAIADFCWALQPAAQQRR